MFKKRLLAYLIDLMILGVILSFAGFLIPNSSNYVNLNNELISVNENFINGNIGFSTFINQYSVINYDLCRELFLSNLIGLTISIIYFVVYPLYNNGQSIGKRLLKIKIVSNDDSSIGANSLFFRYMFIDGIGTSFISLCLIFLFKDFNYMLFVSILGFLQVLVVIISIFMIIYRRDKRSLPDLIAGTKVIEVKE